MALWIPLQGGQRTGGSLICRTALVYFEMWQTYIFRRWPLLASNSRFFCSMRAEEWSHQSKQVKQLKQWMIAAWPNPSSRSSLLPTLHPPRSHGVRRLEEQLETIDWTKALFTEFIPIWLFWSLTSDTTFLICLFHLCQAATWWGLVPVVSSFRGEADEVQAIQALIQQLAQVVCVQQNVSNEKRKHYLKKTFCTSCDLTIVRQWT